MANINITILDNNEVDEIHYKTNAGQVVTANGSTVESELTKIKNQVLENKPIVINNDNPIGSIIYMDQNSVVPDGWLECDGRELSTTEYLELFDIIGYKHGGSGSTFNIPKIDGNDIIINTDEGDDVISNIIAGQIAIIKAKSLNIQGEDLTKEIDNIKTNLDTLDSHLKQKIDLNEDIYYDEITIEKLRDEVSGTTYWLTIIPHTDKNGNIIKLKTGVSEYYETNPNRHESNGTGTDYNNNPNLETARNFSIRKKATLVINAGTWGDEGANGKCVVNGEIKSNVGENPNENPYKRMPLGIKADNTLKAYEYTTLVQNMINDGCIDVVPGFYPILVNGSKYSGTLTFSWTEKHPRTIIGQKQNKEIIIITCDGRTTNENGMSMEDGVRLLLENNCTFGYNLDGGGSTSLVYRNEFINDKIDGGRKAERRLYSFIYIAKEENKDYKSELSNEIIQTNISIGNLKSLIQDVVVDVLNKTDMNLGYIRLKGSEGNIYQGIETWDGENKNCKLVLNKDQMRYYDYNNSRGMFNVDVNGNISTPKGTLGIFNSTPQSITDLDKINETGIYWCTYSAKSAPFSACSGGILHFNINDNNKMQVAFPYTTDNTTYKVKIRRTNASDGSWYDWKDF